VITPMNTLMNTAALHFCLNLIEKLYQIPRTEKVVLLMFYSIISWICPQSGWRIGSRWSSRMCVISRWWWNCLSFWSNRMCWMTSTIVWWMLNF